MNHQLSRYAAGLLVALPLPALAQAVPAVSAAVKEDAHTEAKKQVTAAADAQSAFEFSYAGPGSPALPLIGVAGDQITRSESLRKFGVALLGGLTGQQTGQGIAFDFSPYWLLSSQAMSLAEYRTGKNGLGRIAARTKVGLAASFGDSAAARPSSFVASVSTSLLDRQDKLYDKSFDQCVLGGPIEQAYERIFTEVEQATKRGADRDTLEALQSKLLDDYDKQNQGVLNQTYADCANRLAKAIAAKPSLDIGVGMRWRGTPGQFDQLTGSGTILWGTFATGVIGGQEADAPRAGPLARLRVRGVVHARYTFKDDVFDDKFALQGRRDAGLLVAGIESAPALDPKKTETLRWALQAGWNRQNAVLPTEVDRNYWRYQATVSLRLTDGLWANGTLAQVSGRGVQSDTQAFVTFTFTPPGKATQLAEYYNARGQ
jgi:hypothetical protein